MGGEIMSASLLSRGENRRLAVRPAKKPRTFDQWRLQPGRPTELEATDPQFPVLVVGAGPAGLAAMTALAQAGIAFEGVESHGQAGGIWDQSNPRSSVYDSLTTNTSRYTTHLGHPMPSEWPDFPPHRQAHSYLQAHAEQAGLIPRIRFHTLFKGAAKSPRGTWIAKLRTQDAAHSVTAEYRAIIVATGMHNKQNCIYPEVLRYRAKLCGLPVIHSAEYRNATPYTGKRVLVVGIGVSGTDIANEVSRVAQRTLLSFRSVPWFVPANVFGKPGDVAAIGRTAWLPFWIQRGAFRVIRAMTIGHPRRIGLPVPSHRLLDRFAVTDRGIVEALKTKRVIIRSEVAGIENGLVHFQDGQHKPEPIDAVIFATGYARNYPLLEGIDADQRPLCDILPFLIFHPSEPGIAYMAETITATGCWPVFLEQGRAIAAYFSGEQRGRKNISEFNARRGLPSPDFKRKWYREADGFHVEVRTYTQALKKLTAWLEE